VHFVGLHRTKTILSEGGSPDVVVGIQNSGLKLLKQFCLF